MTTAVRRYSRGRKLVAMRDVQGAASGYYHYDHQGTTQCLTDGAGNVTDRFASDAWGVQVKRTGSNINRHWYIGNWGHHRRDQWLDCVRTRHLAVSLGRWTSRDPIPDQDWYLYAANDPALLIDPGGKKPLGPPSRSRKCFVLSVLGRKQRIGDTTALVDDLHDRLRSRGFKGYLSESEVGSAERPPYPGDTFTKNEAIKAVLSSWLSNKKLECECICFIGYSWGGRSGG